MDKWEKELQVLLEGAAEAAELIDEDELERYADAKRRAAAHREQLQKSEETKA